MFPHPGKVRSSKPYGKVVNMSKLSCWIIIDDDDKACVLRNLSCAKHILQGLTMIKRLDMDYDSSEHRLATWKGVLGLPYTKLSFSLSYETKFNQSTKVTQEPCFATHV